MNTKGTGAYASKLDIRDFAYKPSEAKQKGGTRYQPKDIEDQHSVGICTAISLTQNARKATGIKYSADFQYLLQKKYYDKNWDEGSSARSALHIAHTYGLLPEKEWKHTIENDRKKSYIKYIDKLKKVPEAEIERLIKIASKYKIKAYANIPINRDLMAKAIDESASGIITRYTIGPNWYSGNVVKDEPLQPPTGDFSGHLTTDSNYDGRSFRIANTWGVDWCDKGTAYRLHHQYYPTEAWIPYYNTVPDHVNTDLENRKLLLGQLSDMLQRLIVLVTQLK